MYKHKHNRDICFLYKWDRFSDEDMIYYKVDKFKILAISVKLIKNYFKDFKELSIELEA